MPKTNSSYVKPKYGWKKDTADKRDYAYVANSEIADNLPQRVDLRSYFPRPYNQGNLNSCTANAIASAIEFDEIRQNAKGTPFVPSRLFIYYNEREMENTVDNDSGAQIRDGIKSVAKLGASPERFWPYLEKNLKTKPPKQCYENALKYKALEYRRLHHDLVEMKTCIASRFPFVFGIKVYSSFEGPGVRRTGHLEMPKSSEKLVGKHAVIAAGYDDSREWFLARNSWGEKWGLKGYFTIPYKYLLDPRSFSRLLDDPNDSLTNPRRTFSSRKILSRTRFSGGTPKNEPKSDKADFTALPFLEFLPLQRERRIEQFEQLRLALQQSEWIAAISRIETVQVPGTRLGYRCIGRGCFAWTLSTGALTELPHSAHEPS